MGLLTSDQRAAMDAGNAVFRHIWSIGVPIIGVTYNWTILHDDARGDQLVTNPGSRETEAYNQSLQHPGRMPTGLYSIVCDNSSGRLYETTAGNVWFDSSVGQRAPILCRLKHNIYIRLLSGAWSELAMLAYEGKVNDVVYDEQKKNATLITRALFAFYVDRTWNAQDGDLINTGIDIDHP